MFQNLVESDCDMLRDIVNNQLIPRMGVAISKGRELGEGAATTICCTRYGNVMASRGSVIPLWVEQMMEGDVYKRQTECRATLDVAETSDRNPYGRDTL